MTYLLKDINIRHPAAQRIEQFLGHLIRHPETHQPDGKRMLPVLYGSVPASPTVHALDAMLYAEANLPSAAWPSHMLLNERLKRALSALGTRMIAIDEVHNLEHVKRRQVLHDWVRGLSNEPVQNFSMPLNMHVTYTARSKRPPPHATYNLHLARTFAQVFRMQKD